MRCPFCSADDTRVIDSRLSDDGDSVRRRRECEVCRERFTTFERAELHLPQVIKSATVIPCMMPYITAQFEARKPGDRPLVVPKGSTNLAFLGQFSEIPDDTVFTVEYSVRSAMTAVYTLLHLDREVTPIYKGSHHLGVLWNAMITSLK